MKQEKILSLIQVCECSHLSVKSRTFPLKSQHPLFCSSGNRSIPSNPLLFHAIGNLPLLSSFVRRFIFFHRKLFVIWIRKSKEREIQERTLKLGQTVADDPRCSCTMELCRWEREKRVVVKSSAKNMGSLCWGFSLAFHKCQKISSLQQVRSGNVLELYCVWTFYIIFTLVTSPWIFLLSFVNPVQNSLKNGFMQVTNSFRKAWDVKTVLSIGLVNILP